MRAVRLLFAGRCLRAGRARPPRWRCGRRLRRAGPVLRPGRPSARRRSHGRWPDGRARWCPADPPRPYGRWTGTRGARWRVGASPGNRRPGGVRRARARRRAVRPERYRSGPGEAVRRPARGPGPGRWTARFSRRSRVRTARTGRRAWSVRRCRAAPYGRWPRLRPSSLRRARTGERGMATKIGWVSDSLSTREPVSTRAPVSMRAPRPRAWSAVRAISPLQRPRT